MDKRAETCILIVDDVHTNRVMLNKIFERDYTVIEAVDGVEALARMREYDISAVLLDIYMPRLDGYGVLKEMHQNEKLSGIPVLVVTDGDDEVSQIKALNLGAVDVIGKPYNPHILKVRLQNILSKIEMQRLSAESKSLKQMVEYQKDVIKLSERDALTGLYNRVAFCEMGEKLIAQKEQGYYSLSCFDIDQFKIINDQYGLEVGNLVLKGIAALVSRFVGDDGLACRMFGDSFVMVFKSTLEPDSYKIINEIAEEFLTRGVHIKIQISAGRYIVEDKTLSVSAMIDRALIAKRSVKGRYDKHTAYYNEEMRQRILQEQWVIGEMENALRDGQFEPWFQPQYNHSTGAMVGAETLVRWRHPKKGLISPGFFIPVFERNGFIYEMDKNIWEKACSYLRNWIDTGRTIVPISVNVSRYDVFQPDFFEVLTGLIEKYNIDKSLLKIEITESSFAKETEHIIEIVRMLRDYGLTIEIDDFGSGYSSLNTLKDVPANVLKIDMRFLDGNSDSERSGNILESIIRMAKWLDMPVIAEGVESKIQADYLASIGCVYIQGYYYAKPMPIAEFEKHLKDSKKESKMRRITTVSKMNPDKFWNPHSIETMIFNRYAGGACVFEYCNGSVEMLRVNEKFGLAFNVDLPENLILKYSIVDVMDSTGKKRLQRAIKRAILNDNEESVETKYESKYDPGHIEYVRSTLRMIASSGERYLFYAYVENITGQVMAELKEKRAAKQLREKNKQLKFLNETSANIIMGTNPNKEINAALTKVMQYFRSERSYIFEINERKGTIGNSYEVCAEGIKSKIADLQDIEIGVIDAWIKQFKSNKNVIIEDVSKLSGSREYEQIIFKKQNVKSLLAVPLRKDGRIIGFMGVDNPKDHITHIHNMAALGDYLSVMLSRRDYEAELRRDNDMLSTFMNDTPGGFVRMRRLADSSVVPVFMNDGFCTMVGMTRDEAMLFYKNDSYAGVHPDDLESLMQSTNKMYESGRPCTAKYRIITGNGKYIWVMIFGKVTVDRYGEKFYNIYYGDVSEQLEEEEQQKELVDNLPCGAGIFEINHDTIKAKYMNKRYLEMVNRNKDNVFTKSVMNGVHPDDRERLSAEIDASIKENRETFCSIRVLKGDGTYMPFDFNGRIIKKTRDKIIACGIYIPVVEETRSINAALDERRIAQQKEQEANKKLEFLNEATGKLIMGSNFEDALKSMLMVVLDYFGGDRAHIYSTDFGKHESYTVYEVCRDGIKSRLQEFEDIPFVLRQFWLKKFEKENMVRIDSVSGMPDSCMTEKSLLNAKKISAIIAVPIRRNDKLLGYMGVDNPTRNLEHTENYIMLGNYLAINFYRHEIDSRLKTENDIMNMLMNDLPGGFVRMRSMPDGKIKPTFINDGICRMMKISREGLFQKYGDDLRLAIHPDDREKILKHIRKCVEQGHPFSTKYRVLTGDGDYKMMQVNGVLRVNEDGERFLNEYYAETDK